MIELNLLHTKNSYYVLYLNLGTHYKEVHIGIGSESVCKALAMQILGPEFRLTEKTQKRMQCQDSVIPVPLH